MQHWFPPLPRSPELLSITALALPRCRAAKALERYIVHCTVHSHFQRDAYWCWLPDWKEPTKERWRLRQGGQKKRQNKDQGNNPVAKRAQGGTHQETEVALYWTMVKVKAGLEEYRRVEGLMVWKRKEGRVLMTYMFVHVHVQW